MKKYILYFSLLLLAPFLSCEDVIDVKLKTAAPQLVVSASIEWQKGTLGNEQFIKLSTTTDYFAKTIPVVSNATVFVTNSNNKVFNFTEKIPNTGEYFCTTFEPQLNENYTLTIIYKGQTYTAKETLKSVNPITKVEQSKEGGFTGDNVQIKAFFNDQATEANFYMIKYYASISKIPSFDISDDRFTQGNEIFGLYFNEDLKKDDTVNLILYGISQRYFEYLRKLTAIAGSSSGGPFATPPAPVRGNIINTTNAKEFALGYFNASETDSKKVVIE